MNNAYIIVRRTVLVIAAIPDGLPTGKTLFSFYL